MIFLHFFIYVTLRFVYLNKIPFQVDKLRKINTHDNNENQGNIFSNFYNCTATIHS